MEHNAVGWFEIYVQDMQRARKFYEAVFRVELQALGDPNDPTTEMMAFSMEMDRLGANGALVRKGGSASGGNSTVVYFICSDCAEAASRVEKAGGRIHTDKVSIGEFGYMALAYDTEGNMFGMHSMK